MATLHQPDGQRRQAICEGSRPGDISGAVVALKAGRYRLEQDARSVEFSVDGSTGRAVSLVSGD